MLFQFEIGICFIGKESEPGPGQYRAVNPPVHGEPKPGSK